MAAITPAYVATWPKPNYDNPETTVDVLLGVEIPITALMVAFISIRCYSRIVIKRAFGQDDWWMVAAAVVSLGNTIMNCVATEYGTGYHLWDVKEEWFLPTGKMAWAAQILLPFIVSFTKISICISYLRIFPSKGNRIFCYGCIIFLCMYCLAIFFSFVFQCTPVATYWQVFNPKRKCYNETASLIAAAAINTLTDLAVFLWPARFLATLQMPLGERINLIISFSLGLIVCVAGICRIWYLTVYFNTPDLLYTGAILLAISAIEFNVGIICGCIPSCRPLFKRVLPSIRGLSNSNKSSETARKDSKFSRKSSRSPPDSHDFPFQNLDGKGRSKHSSDLEDQRYIGRESPVVDDEYEEQWGHADHPILQIQVQQDFYVGEGVRIGSASAKSDELLMRPDQYARTTANVGSG